MSVGDPGAGFQRLIVLLKSLRKAHAYAEAHPKDIPLHERHRENLRAFRAEVQRWRADIMNRRALSARDQRGLLESSRAAVERARSVLAAVQGSRKEMSPSSASVARAVNAQLREQFRAAHAAGLAALRRHDYKAVESALALERDAITQFQRSIDDASAFIRDMRAFAEPGVESAARVAKKITRKRATTKRQPVKGDRPRKRTAKKR